MTHYALSAASILEAWERGAGQSPLNRALTLLRQTDPAHSLDALACLPVGVRDKRLWSIRKATFGDRVTALATCRQCGDTLEFSFRVSEVCPAEEPAFPSSTSWEHDAWSLTFRLPDTLDLAALGDLPATLPPGRMLAARILESATHDDLPVSVDELPDEVLYELEARLAEIDPLPDLTFALQCPHCHHAWEEAFDIASFLWTEIEAEAHRLLREVGVLARTFGWSEHDILQFSPTRRQAYLELAES